MLFFTFLMVLCHHGGPAEGTVAVNTVMIFRVFRGTSGRYLFRFAGLGEAMKGTHGFHFGVFGVSHGNVEMIFLFTW